MSYKAAQNNTITVERRCDRLELGPPTETDEGFLVVEGVIAKPGILTYMQASGGTVRELVPPETLAEADAIRSLKLKPVTVEHPAGDVDSSNVEGLRVGSVSETIRIDDNGILKARFTIETAEAISKVRSGKQQLSPGYRVQLDKTPGVHPKYGRYDVVQRQRRYNHLAIVDQARGGPEVSLRADAGYDLDKDEQPPANLAFTFNMDGNMEWIMKMLLAEGIKAEEAQKLAAKIDIEIERRAEEMAKEEATELADAEGEKAPDEEAEVEPTEEELKADDAKRLAWYNERKRLEGLCEANKVDHKDLSNAAMKLAILKALKIEVKKDSAPGFVDGVIATLQVEVKTDAKEDTDAFALENKKDSGGDKYVGNRYINSREKKRLERLGQL